MKTDLLVLAGTTLMLAAAPAVLHAEHNEDWTLPSPLAMGEPVEDCDIHHHDVVIAIQPVPPLAAEKVEAILAAPDVVPAKASPASTTQAAPRHWSPAALLSFALIASPGTALPQNNSSAGRD